MAYLAIRGSGSVNGVSRLHGKVSRHLFEPLFPHWPADEVPIGHVTNGVHMPTWDSAAADDLWTKACGKDRWLGSRKIWSRTFAASPTTAFGNFAPPPASRWLNTPANVWPGTMPPPARRPRRLKRRNILFDPNVLTWVLRGASPPTKDRICCCTTRSDCCACYPIRSGRCNSSLRARRIRRTRRDRPDPEMDSVHSPTGGSSSRDFPQRLRHAIDRASGARRGCLAQHAARPWEACGTSGMKVLVNGGINLSELDGWWAEAYMPDLGWALGDGQEHGDDPAWDAAKPRRSTNGSNAR
jgi:glycogen phosphorylase